MSGARAEARVLKLTLHDELVGYLTGFGNGQNILVFDQAYRSNPARPTFSLVTHPNFPNAGKLLAEPWVKKQRLHPVLSNLLPEGALKEFVAGSLKIHPDNEFPMFAWLGEDLPGAIVAQVVEPDDIPAELLGAFGSPRPVRFKRPSGARKFSLAGVQMKFSMKAKDGRFNLASPGELGDWIIKTPSTTHRYVPQNEFTAMSLARSVGIDVPEIRLVELDDLESLPDISLPAETQAFAIRRFDREGGNRVHMEDFAQILVKYPHEKYGAANYEQIGKVIYAYSGDPLRDIQEYAKRLLVNILLGNGDAHLKNWSMLYKDRFTPGLSPAYDIVTTCAYIEDEHETALNLAKTKSWRVIDYAHFERWAKQVGVPWRAVRPQLADVLDRARATWRDQLKDLPMHDPHKRVLTRHWASLTEDFRIS
ncbi:type II toxin-antitoxin system HipA family toxin [Alcanivorax sp. JB21]|uniref:type II toxin-antitoxin system HipA family toxin n=1 Tax=Alcanivorax limicola TaxID=2874102 RepID=UPI001CBF29C2|nr:type II toxin-antitoxin system HipA family toxin [Alcanivorax limicola]MBZ2188491.1 type II toxin-antitoxin system HipA family toxin [Alcanivorax limicola]